MSDSSHHLPPYPASKESGVPWLGAIPAHWDMVRNKTLFSRRREIVGDRHKDFTLLSLTLRGVITRDMENAKGKFPADFGSYQTVHTNDFVFCLFDIDETPRTVGVAQRTGMITGAYTVLTPQAADPTYLYYLFLSFDERKALKPLYTGLRKVIPEDRFLRAKSPLPPPEEQTAIARYLDYVDRRIRRYIRAKRRLIEVLTEQKQAIIHQAVTRGLDPDVPMKDSGVAWLGEIPAHWNQFPTKRVLSKADYGTSEATKSDGRVRVLTMGNIQNGEVTDASFGRLNHVPDELLLEHYDLLFTRTNGNPDLVGKIGIFRGTGSDLVSFASYLVRFRVAEPHIPQWLHLLLSSTTFWRYARSHALVNLQTNLNPTRYGQFLIPVPPPMEQNLIVGYIAKETGIIVDAIENAKEEIALLREYRTRLIADVVTGKVDVRGAVVSLPVEVGDEEMENGEAWAEDAEDENGEAVPEEGEDDV
jgi:type I restriction enzyme, S subunit